jgi:hypothetical protein
MPQGARRDELPELDAVDVLHDEIGSLLRVVVEVEDRDNVRIRELGDEAGLLGQHRHEPPLVRQLRSHALDGHRTMEPVRASNGAQEHLGVTTDPDRALDLAAIEARCIKGHRLKEEDGRIEDAGHLLR